MEGFGRTFTLSDGVTSRVASFRMPNAKTGLEIASLGLNPEDPEMLIKLAETAAKHLILHEDKSANFPRQEITGFDELTFIFSDPFIGVKLVREFEADLDPLLKRLKI